MAVLFGACTPNPGGTSASAATTVKTKWGGFPLIRQFMESTLTWPSVPSGCRMHRSYKPPTTITNGQIDALLTSAAGHWVTFWHEPDNDGLSASARTARIALMNRLYDRNVALGRPCTIVPTFTGGLFALYSTDADRAEWFFAGGVKGDLLGADLDGVHDTTAPIGINYADEVDGVMTVLDEWGTVLGYTGWTVPEFGTSRQSSYDPTGNLRAAWITQQVDAVILDASREPKGIAWYDYNTPEHNTATNYNALNAGTPEFTVWSDYIDTNDQVVALPVTVGLSATSTLTATRIKTVLPTIALTAASKLTAAATVSAPEGTTTPAVEWFLTDVDLRHNRLINTAVQASPTSPSGAVKGQLWFDDSVSPGTLKYFDGTSWTGGRAYYGTVLDDAAARPQRGKLNFRSTTSIDATVLDEGVQDQSSVQLTTKYGPVIPAVASGEVSSNGSAPTVARSDHVHGTPSSAGADTVLISWWEHNEELWTQLTSATNFIADLPGQVVGGGWLLTVPGSVYWTGSPVPMSPHGVYRNSVRVSAVNNQTKVTCGWLCYDASQNLLGSVKCINAAPVEATSETGTLVKRNHIWNPSGESALGFGPSDQHAWHSNAAFGSGAVGNVSQSTEQSSERSHSIKATWAGLSGTNNHSNCVAVTDLIPPNTPMTLRAKVYVPTGSPRVALDVVFYASSGFTELKNQWVTLQVQFTTPDDGISRGYYCGMKTDQNADGTVAYMDEVIFYEGWDNIPGGRSYFDGNTTSTDEQVFAWDGAADFSPSGFYTLEPAWVILTGYITPGDGAEPPVGEVADVEDAVTPFDSTAYFRPYIACAGGTMIVDTHEVARSTRDMAVMDGVHTDWLIADATVQAGNVVTPDVAPPDTEPPTLIRIGPVYDPPQADSDVVPKSYVDRVFGAFGLDPETGEVPPFPPQFLWSGDPGVDPQPADLGFLFDAWPLFSTWFDTSVPQARPMIYAGTPQATTGTVCPAVGTTWTQVSDCYGVVLTPPADGVLVGISTGSVYATYTEYMELQCRAIENVDESGNGGTAFGASGPQVFSASSGATVTRMGYTLFAAAKATAGVRCKLATYYINGGASATVTRDRVYVLYLPGTGIKP